MKTFIWHIFLLYGATLKKLTTTQATLVRAEPATFGFQAHTCCLQKKTKTNSASLSNEQVASDTLVSCEAEAELSIFPVFIRSLRERHPLQFIIPAENETAEDVKLEACSHLCSSFYMLEQQPGSELDF